MRAVAPRAQDGIPLYIKVAADLELGILGGRHAVGELLPNEAQLQKSYGVSRFTVREALSRLQASGVLEKRHGVGTRVVSAPARKRIAYAVDGLDSLAQSAQQARLDKIDAERRRLRPYEAAGLGLNRTHAYLVIRARRVLIGDPRHQLAFVKVYVPLAYSAIAEDIGRSSELVIRLIEHRYGVVVDRIRQEISAPKLNSALCREMRALGIKTSERTLVTRRVYLDKAGTALECTESVFLDPEFTFVTTLSRTVDKTNV